MSGPREPVRASHVGGGSLLGHAADPTDETAEAQECMRHLLRQRPFVNRVEIIKITLYVCHLMKRRANYRYRQGS